MADKIRIAPDGSITFVYRDGLRGLLRHGKSEIRRASHVEPTDDCRWTADLSPVGGPVLGPFDDRESALQAEVAWLKENLGRVEAAR